MVFNQKRREYLEGRTSDEKWTPENVVAGIVVVVVTVTICLLALQWGGLIGTAMAGDRCSKTCQERVNKRVAHQKWGKAVRAYGIGLLRARMNCESGNHGGYRLSTTGNGFWFAHQFEVRAWVGAGGRVRGGRPVGVWERQPSRLEQDVRAVRWAAIHGGDPWPNCP